MLRRAGLRTVAAATAMVAIFGACGTDTKSSPMDATRAATPDEPGGLSGSIIVLAASDLRGAFDKIGAAFEETCDCRVTLSYGSSGTYVSQVKQGSPGDVFASASASYVDDLERNGLIAAGTRQDYAFGRIVLATNAGSSMAPGLLTDLEDPRFKRIAIANPDHAPYGLAAKQALTALGLWDAIEPKLVLGENASQATQYVQTGDADAGIIPLSLAIQNADHIRYVLIDDSLHEPLRQTAAVLRQSKQADVAKAFLTFVNGPAGRAVMSEYGFVLPGEGAP